MTYKFYTLLFICTLLYCNLSVAQTEKNTPSQKTTKNTFDNKIKDADSLLILNEFSSAGALYDELYLVAQESEDSSRIEAILFKKFSFEKAACINQSDLFPMLSEIEEFCKERNSNTCYTKIYYEFAEYYYERGVFDKSLYYYNKTLEILDPISDPVFTYKLFLSRGVLYASHGFSKEGISDFKKSLDYVKEEKYKIKKAKAYSNIAISFDEEAIDSSIYYSSKAYDLLKDEPFSVDFMFVCYNYASLHSDNNQPQRALKIMNEHLNLDSLVTDQDLNHNFAKIINLAGNIYYDLEKYERALFFFKKAKFAASKTNLEEQLDFRKDLLKLYQKQGNSKMIYELTDDIAMLEAISDNYQTNRELAVMERKMDVLEKEQAINKLQKTNAVVVKESKFTKRLLLRLVVLLLSLLVIIIMLYFYNKVSRYRIQERLTFFRLSSLHSSMNPHFLFNTFSTLQNYILKNNNTKANLYMTELSSHIRNVFNSSETTFIDFNSEIKILKGYIKLQKDRFDNKFEVKYQIDKTIELTNPTIPSMMIQPFVENAIIHGFSKTSAKHKLTVVAKEQEDSVKIEIVDNGVGREASYKNKGNADTSSNLSIATKNTIERLNILNKLHKGKSSVIIEDLMDTSGQSAGTKVTIVLSTTHS